MRQELDSKGYLLFREFFERRTILQLRKEILASVLGIVPELETKTIQENPWLKSIQNSGNLSRVYDLVHQGPLKEHVSQILGGPARAFDYVWSRIVGPGECTTPHCDTVYMNRGTSDLYTAWIPLGDIPLRNGPLMILEHSHRLEKLDSYRALDIDRDWLRRQIVFKHGNFFRGFHYSKNPERVRKEFGLRWLTHDFRAGDVLFFSVHHLHGTLDNLSETFRVVLDARYQLATQPIDERYIGESPTGHSLTQIYSHREIKNLFRRWIF